ncbi:CpaF family protein [Amycolatopsis rubida]|uniref:CpaF family protein n=1 Tax=Amycolatopsis rubida TaxID=112413 RepID=A0ABX0BWX7_9PSEU|nr:ATPase, T2SS/T4P/T4SS family [Amycolatopsis sp. M39]MYW90496.1 CpaF family protein [Amycolatopsis rubida]MYW95136.1 CpaF family protein [Amycolatopsis rubida]NEC55475.1 CpaF family protein [Amycolatopsis rubida]NEC60124.1 CpaF family protein [Amycolatopsis rubida]
MTSPHIHPSQRASRNGASVRPDLPPPACSLPGPTSVPGVDPHQAAAVERLRVRLRRELSQQLSSRIHADDDAGRPALEPGERRRMAQAILADAAEKQAQHELDTGGAVVPQDVEQRVVSAVLDEMFGMAGLDPLLANPDIENVNINGDRVFVRYASGRRERLPPIIGSDAELVDLIRDLAARSGVEERRFDRGSPIVNFSLPGGERASAVMAVTARPSLSIRRHRFARVTLRELRENGTLDLALDNFLTAMVRARKNVLVTGGVAIGKTTLLRALASAIPPHERLVTIEDVFELGLDHDPGHPDVVAMQAREANVEGQGEISQSELVWQSLRMSPDRVIVGEVRGPVVIPLTNAMSMGNDGSMGTLHSSLSSGVFTKLAAYAVQGPERLSLEATNLLVASALHFVVHLEKPRGEDNKRVVSSIREVIGADGTQVISNEVWRPAADLRAVPGVPLRTATVDDLVDAGFDPDLLDRAEGWWKP